MLKTKGHQVAGKVLRNWYTFTENFLFFLFTLLHLNSLNILPSFLPLFPFLWGLHPISVRMEGPESKMYSPPEKRSGNDENDPMLTPHSQQISCRYIVYTYNLYWDVFQNWNRSKMGLCCTMDIDLKKTFCLFKNLRARTKAPHLLAPFE